MKKLFSGLILFALITSITIIPVSASNMLDEQTITADEFFDTLVKEYAKYDIRLVPGEYSADQIYTKAYLDECITEAKAEGIQNLALSQEVIDLGTEYATDLGIIPRATYTTQTLSGDPTYTTTGPIASVRLRVSVDVKCDLVNKRIVSASNVKVQYRGGVGYIGMDVVSTSTDIDNNPPYNSPLVRVNFTLDLHYQSSIGGLPVTKYVTRSFTDTFFPNLS